MSEIADHTAVESGLHLTTITKSPCKNTFQTNELQIRNSSHGKGHSSCSSQSTDDIIFAGWIALWLLKPTNLWTRKWKAAEDGARHTVFGYYGLNFAVFTFPPIALTIIGLVYLDLVTEGTSSKQLGLTMPASVMTSKKLMPVKSLKLDLWQIKYLRVATRFGLLAEVCLALLLLPVLRGLAIFQLIGIQFEASVRYHILLGDVNDIFSTIHGASTLFIWGVSRHIQDEFSITDMEMAEKKGRIYLAGEIALVTGLLLRILQSRPQSCILSARIYLIPSKAIELTLPKDPGLKYTPTSVIYMKIPSISKFQWHPFSITSSSNIDDHTMSVVVKCNEGWTSSLYDMIQAELDSDTGAMNCIPRNN
ncbi:hypothetical protein H0E87_022299 [Populus deltoides]|uniref:FAD-binding FR-type domain-containing protein n=1 Tax=Populus deltoides TaxID=3696 RepID=A0A8T2XJU5_POPDE|nr:hypothetical protein H0E87_022299 [Populus deltoides]